MNFKQSPFLHIVSMDDEYVFLYHSLSLEVAFLRRSFIEQCQQGQLFVSFDAISERILNQLKKIGLFIEEQADGYDLYQKYQKALEEPAINILYLLLSDDCNIRCRYCYFLAPMPRGYKSSLMKKDTAVKALDLFARFNTRLMG